MDLAAARALVSDILLPRYPGATAAVIGGSIARGEQTATSDIDLLLLFDDVPNAWRDTLKLGAQTVEIFGHDLRTFDYFCRVIDRPAGRIPLAMMVIDGQNVVDETAGYTQLKAMAWALHDEGPPPLDAGALASRRYEITNLLEDLVDSTAADETLAVAVKLYDTLANFVLRAGGTWTGTGKHLARRLRAFDAASASGLHAAMTAIMSDPAAGKARFTGIVQRVLQPYGGQLLEGHTLQAPAHWKSPA